MKNWEKKNKGLLEKRSTSCWRRRGILGDLVVKSTTTSEHCSALCRVFQILRKHQLKLNLEKCSFGVQAGKFLGFMLREREIEANLENC
ncbi:hypothetical protein CR513_31314, partial [Mucuna pruriens]